MSPIRLAITGLAALAAATPAMAQQSCLQPAERAAFDFRSLQSQMMVGMLICEEHRGPYQQFLTRYDPQIRQSFNGMRAHYRRTAGARFERTLDSYVTQLAQSQSQDATRQGSSFCRNIAPLYTQAAAAPNDMNAMAELAARNNIGNPHGRADCSAATPAAATRSSGPARRSTARGRR